MAEEPASPPSVEPSAAPVAPSVVPAVVEAPAAPISADPPVPESTPSPSETPPAPAEVIPPDVETPTPEPAPETPAEVVEAKPEPVAYTEFKLPDGVEAPAERIAEFTSVLGKYGLTQEAGQELMDLHGAALKAMATEIAAKTTERQFDAFADTRAGWRGDAQKEFGNRYNTVVEDAKWAKHELIGKDKKTAAAFEAMIEYTGVGDHPAMIGLLASVAKRLRERSAPSQGIGAKPAPSTPWDGRYAKSART